MKCALGLLLLSVLLISSSPSLDLQLYTFLETLLDVIVLLPSFIKFFSQALKHSSSPGKLASLVLAFGEF